MIEKDDPETCNHMVHKSTDGIPCVKDRTDFCYCCGLEVTPDYPHYEKMNPNVNHFPDGVYNDCRVVLEGYSVAIQSRPADRRRRHRRGSAPAAVVPIRVERERERGGGGMHRRWPMRGRSRSRRCRCLCCNRRRRRGKGKGKGRLQQQPMGAMRPQTEETRPRIIEEMGGPGMSTELGRGHQLEEGRRQRDE